MHEDWQADLERWLAPYLEGLGNKTRRRMCPAYIAGLIGPGDRKSIQPMAARSGAIAYDRLHHFIGAGLWDSAPLEATLWSQADELVGGDRAWLIIDDTALPKKGKASVGVTPQYATALGKNANCQTLVSVTLASGEVPVMLSLRLFLPESWTSNTVRMDKAGVPASFREYRTKPEIAIEEIDRVIAAGVRFGCVGRCRLRAVRSVPAGAERARPLLGRRHPPAPESLPGRRATDLPGGGSRATAGAARAGRQIPGRTRHARRREVATGQLAKGNQGASDRALCRHACAHR